MKYLLTGGHSGIGLELSKMLLAEGHHLGLIVRTEGRKQETLRILGDEGKVDFFLCDLSKQAQIAEVAKDISQSWDQIDGLFNNAGLLTDQAYYSEQGNEMQFEVNTIAPYLLTKALKPLLDKADAAFVVNTATGGLHNQKAIDIGELKKPSKFVKLLGSYMKSKLAMVAIMNFLAEEWPEIRILSVDPGPNKTKMTSGSGVPNWIKPFRRFLFSSPDKGARLLYQATFHDQFEGLTGVYISGNKAREMKLTVSQAEIDEMIS
ncbi:MAG: SDR family NAD(P)-dependent oxidoreductase [Bacteroidota bacterium]